MAKAKAKWVYIGKVCRELNCRDNLIYLWHRRVCPRLKRKLRLRRRPNLGRAGRGKHRTYVSRIDFEELLAIPTFTGEYRDDKGALWFGTRKAAEHFCVSVDCLREWRESDCPWLGQKLQCIHLPVMEICLVRGEEGEDREVRRFTARYVYLVSDLVKIVAGMARDPNLLTHEEVREQYGFSVATLHLWRTQEKGCPYLGGKKLTSHKIPVKEMRERRGKQHRYARWVRVFVRAESCAPSNSIRPGWQCA
jgi:hypothetical protein